MTEMGARSLICRMAFVMAALSIVMLANYVWITYLGWSFLGWERVSLDDRFVCHVAPIIGGCHADLSILIHPFLWDHLSYYGDRLPVILGVSVLIWLLVFAVRRALWSKG